MILDTQDIEPTVQVTEENMIDATNEVLEDFKLNGAKSVLIIGLKNAEDDPSKVELLVSGTIPISNPRQINNVMTILDSVKDVLRQEVEHNGQVPDSSNSVSEWGKDI